MPMMPGDGESKDQFISRCIEHEMGKGRENSQAVAMCESMWENPGKAVGGIMHRAYSMLTVKSVDHERRTISGVATTPTTDRVGDIVEPMGARYKTPHPLHLYHNTEKPVGTVDFARPTKEGIPFTASLPIVKEPGVVQDRVNEALHSLQYRLLGAVSIGFAPVADQIEVLKGGGLRYKIWDWLETSLVSVPANPDAVLMSFKSMDPVKIRTALSITERPGVVKLDESTLRRAREGDKAGVVYLKK